MRWWQEVIAEHAHVGSDADHIAAAVMALEGIEQGIWKPYPYEDEGVVLIVRRLEQGGGLVHLFGMENCKLLPAGRKFMRDVWTDERIYWLFARIVTPRLETCARRFGWIPTGQSDERGVNYFAAKRGGKWVA